MAMTPVQAFLAGVRSGQPGARSIGDWEQSVIQALQNAGAPVPRLSDGTTGFGMEVDLKPLPYDVRDRLIRERQEILNIDFDRVTDSPNWRPRRLEEVGSSKKGYGHITIPWQRGMSEEDAYQHLLYATQSYKLSVEGGKTFIDGLSSSFVSDRMLRQTAAQMTDQNLLRGGTRLLFDVETGGLAKESNIWQVSARMFDDAGQEIKGKGLNLMFDNPYLDRGLMQMDGKAVTSQQFMAHAAKQAGKEGLDEFVQGMSQFMDLFMEADTVIAHNAKFDVGMIEWSLNQAGGDEAFQGKVSKFLKKAHSQKMIDTRLWAMATLGDIGVADELVQLEKITPYSMENILLETDLLDRIARRRGVDVSDLAGELADLHYAHIDTLYEHDLFLELKAGIEDPANKLQVQRLAREDLRQVIRGSAAITPFTKGVEVGDELITPIEYLVRSQRNLERNFIHDVPLERSALQAGTFRAWVDSVRGQDGGLRGGTRLVDSGFAGYTGEGTEGLGRIGGRVQGRAAAAGVPFAGLASYERLVSHALAEATETGSSLFRDVIGSTRVDVHDAASIQDIYRRGLLGERTGAAISQEILAQAEMSGVFRDVQFLDADALPTARVSVYKNTMGQTRASVLMDLTKRDLEGLSSWLEGLSSDDLKRMGLNNEAITEMVSRLRSGVTEAHGVQIGTLRGSEEGMNRLFRLMKDLGLDVDQHDMPTVRGILHYSDAADEIRMGPVMLDTGGVFDDAGRVSEEAAPRVRKQMGRLVELTNFAAQEEETNHALRMAARLGRGDGDKAIRYYDFLSMAFDKGFTPGRVAVGLAAAIFGGYYMNRKSKQGKYDHVFEEQPYEPKRDRIETRMDSVPRTAYRTDPRNTAGLTSQLYNNRIGHHRMGPNRYDHLF